MLVRKIFCPDCGVSRPASHAPGHGNLYECPGCRLLFIPAAEDVRWVDVAEARRPDELSYGEGPRQPVDYRRPIRRFYRVDAPGILMGVFVSTGVLLAAAAGVFLVAYGSRDEPRPPVAATPALPVPALPVPPPPVAATPDAAPPIPPIPSPVTPTVTLTAGDTWLGDWDADDQLLDGVGPAAVYSLSLRTGGMLTLRCRSGTDLETIEATWSLAAAGPPPRLRLNVPDANGRHRTIEVTLSIEGMDRLRIAVAGGGSAAFRRQ